MKKLLIIPLLLLLSCTDNYNEGVKKYNLKNYNKALVNFKNVDSSHINFDKAQNLIVKIDSILKAEENKKYVNDSLIKAETKKQDSLTAIKEVDDFKALLEREIKSFNEFDGTKYKGDLESIQIEIALFVFWANNIKKTEKHNDNEIVKLGKTLKTKTIALQTIEFPKLRYSYGKLLGSKLWVENIKAKTKGVGYSVLEFEGAFFANNKNIQTTQKSLSEMLEILRFKRVNYKWYKYDNEYTYYSLNTLQDGALVEL